MRAPSSLQGGQRPRKRVSPNLPLLLLLVLATSRSATSADPTPTTTTVDFTDSSVVFDPAFQWMFTSDSQSMFTLSRGAGINYQFFGTQIQMFGAKNSLGAQWSLVIDDGLVSETLSSFRPGSKVPGLLLFDSGQLSDKNALHSLRVQHIDRNGKAIDFAKFEVFGLASDVSPTVNATAAAKLAIEQSTTSSSSSTISSSASVASRSSATFTTSSASDPAHHSSTSSAASGATSSPSPDEAGSDSATASVSDLATSSSARATPPAVSSPPDNVSSTSSTDTSTEADSSLNTSATTSGNDNQDQSASQADNNRVNLLLVIPVSAGAPAALLVICAIVHRYMQRRAREKRRELWYHGTGLRADLDFGCRGGSQSRSTSRAPSLAKQAGSGEGRRDPTTQMMQQVASDSIRPPVPALPPGFIQSSGARRPPGGLSGQQVSQGDAGGSTHLAAVSTANFGIAI